MENDFAADGAYRPGSRNNAIFDSSLESRNYIKISARVVTKGTISLFVCENCISKFRTDDCRNVALEVGSRD